MTVFLTIVISLVVILHIALQIWITFTVVNSENFRTVTKVSFIAQTWLLGPIGVVYVLHWIRGIRAFSNIKF